MVQVELCVYCPVAGDELTVSVLCDLTLQVNFIQWEDNLLATTVYTEVQWNVHLWSQEQVWQVESVNA